MISTAYNLKMSPFLDRIEPDDMYLQDRMLQGLKRLEYFAQDGQAAMLTGSTGVGKSSLVRIFLERLPNNHYHPIVLESCRLESAALLRLIVTELGEKPRMGRDRLYNQIVDKARSQGRILILVVEEAHLLNEETLTDLRLISSHERKLILVGQQDLCKLLARARLLDLASRISTRISLMPFSHDQTRAYLDHRLMQAGGDPELIDDDAADRIHAHSGGVPRLINNLCTSCFLRGAIEGIPMINKEMVEEAAIEIRAFA